MTLWPRTDGRGPSQAQRLFRRLLGEWLLVCLVLLAVTAWLSLTQGPLLGNGLYDRLSRLTALAPDPRILIVSIDDRSLQQLGRWPWPRSLHADVLDQLHEAQARTVLFDVLFSEPDRSGQDDRQLADALCRAANVWLPLLRDQAPLDGSSAGAVQPVEPLRGCAAGVGHINVEADSDGVVRSVYLREGAPEQAYGQLAWQVYAQQVPPGQSASMPGLGAKLADNGWQRDHRIRIPFIDAASGFPTVPYVSVLKGEVPASLLRNRLVLIGSTAPGLGDRYATPVSGSAGTTAGVEIQANILNGLLQQRSILDVPSWLATLMSLTVVALVLGALLGLPRYALWLTLGGLAGVLLAAAGLLRHGWWWSPAPSMIGVLLGYLLWNWRRLSVILAYFGWELARLNDEPKVLPERRRRVAAQGDVLQGSIAALEQALSRTRDTRRFMADGLECLPIATLICDTHGRILLCNRSARAMLGEPLLGGNFLDCLAGLGHPAFAQGARPELAALTASEFRDHRERSLYLQPAPLLQAEAEVLVGWLFSLSDLSIERDAEQQRATLLRFLSHDLRAPHSAILALLDVQRGQGAGDALIYRQVEQQVRRALGLTDGFVQLARAESDSYRFQPTIFAMLVLDALDQATTHAQLKGIDLRHQLEGADECRVQADPALLTRALFNLLENAIKYSPPGSTVTLSVAVAAGWLHCRIQDEGPGIAAHDLPQLFAPYHRLAGAQGSDGLGLGLAMVKTVIERHGGRISCSSVPGQGAIFSLDLAVFDE